MNRYSDIDPQDIDPDTGRPYSNYSSASLDTSFHDGERADQGEAGWLLWCRHAEALIGCDLDGNEETDCFSIDGAYQACWNGQSALDYAKAVQRRRQAKGLPGIVPAEAFASAVRAKYPRLAASYPHIFGEG